MCLSFVRIRLRAPRPKLAIPQKISAVNEEGGRRSFRLTRPFPTLVLSLEIRCGFLEQRDYAPEAFKSSLACFSAFFASAFASASGFMAWIALLKLIDLSPAGP